jgi:hypothetical protein
VTSLEKFIYNKGEKEIDRLKPVENKNAILADKNWQTVTQVKQKPLKLIP